MKTEDSADAFSQYKIALNNYNRQLSRLSEILHLQFGLASYTARHSGAKAARNHNIPISVISAGMGHSSEQTTRIYLTTFIFMHLFSPRHNPNKFGFCARLDEKVGKFDDRLC